MTEPAVIISNLEVRFSGKAVLKDIHLSLWPGRITILVGPSGSGKSTLLRAINRLNEFFPDCQTRGSVSLHLQNQYHVDIYQNTIPLSDLRRRVGMVFQTPAVLPFSIEKNITMPLQVTVGLSGSALTERMTRALQEVALWDEVKDRLRSSANNLSGGQQQRLCLARVLALEPQILLLDEPTASLDYKSAARIESLLLTLKERYTILAVSHSLSQTRRIADRVNLLRQGQLIQEMDRNDMADIGAFQGLMEAAF